MKQDNAVVDPLTCPLCGGNNACDNISTADATKTCWCRNTAIAFPKELLLKIPAGVKGKACICQTCAMTYQDDNGVKIYEPPAGQ